MLLDLLKRLAAIASKSGGPASDALNPVDRFIAQGRRAEEAGKPSEACESYRKAIALAPNYAPAHLNLGIGLEAVGDNDGALKSYEMVLAIDPGNAFASYNLGKLHFLRRDFVRAENHLRAALQSYPRLTEAQVVLANVLGARGDAVAAVAAFESAVQQRPGDFGAWYGYGNALRNLGRNNDAEAALQRACALDLGNLDVHATLFDLIQSRGDLAAAEVHLKTVLQTRPDWVDALFNHASILTRMERLGEAEAPLRRVMALDPQHVPACRMLCSVLHRQGRISDVLEVCRTGRSHNPGALDIESFELFALNFVDAVTAEELSARHKMFGARLERLVPERFLPFHNNRDPDRKLRVGYISGDFCFHPVALFLGPLLERHDRLKFDAYCYSVGGKEDDMTRRIMAAAATWRDMKSVSETELADAVYRDSIDILVDLSGHSGISKLGVFAQRPAPVQAAWLGYLSTTGLTRIQYRISDRHSDPPGPAEHFHTETLVRLPHAQWCYRPFLTVDVAAAAAHESNGWVTFGVFTQIAKLTAAMRSLWVQILLKVPTSRLVVAGTDDDRMRGKLLDALVRDGIHASRVTLLPFMPVQDYFRAFDGIDIALDTSPYSGGTTSCDALWMGVPVLTMPGSRPCSRSAASVLTTLGLLDWIAASPEEYVERAVRFASERKEIGELRRSLRERMRASPLMQEDQFACDMEQTYRAMWHEWCAASSS